MDAIPIFQDWFYMKFQPQTVYLYIHFVWEAYMVCSDAILASPGYVYKYIYKCILWSP